MARWGVDTREWEQALKGNVKPVIGKIEVLKKKTQISYAFTIFTFTYMCI
jgi:hypothetical protein